MSTINLSAALSKLQEYGYTIKLGSLRRTDEEERSLKGWVEAGRIPDKFERTPMDLQLVFAFDTKTYEYLEWLKSEGTQIGSEWYLISINPNTSPLLDANDWIQAAPSREGALGWVIEAMNNGRVEPLSVTTLDDGGLSIDGEAGKIAIISPIKFESVEKKRADRAKRTLRNLRFTDAKHLLAEKLSKIEGLSGLCKPSDPSLNYMQKNSTDRQCIDVNAANLCLSLLEALQPHVVQTISLSAAQEILAVYMGFDSWNVLRGMEKKRSHCIHEPYVLSTINVLDEYESEYKEHKFYRNLVEGLVGYGQVLKNMDNNRATTIKFYGHLSLSNGLENINGKTVPHEELSLKALEKTYADDSYILVAREMLESTDIDMSMREYFFTGQEPLERAKKIGARFGFNKDDYMSLGDWLVSYNRSADRPFVVVEKHKNIGKYDSRDRFSAYKHKISVVIKDDEFWLASDWDRKPKFHLSGVNAEDISQLESAFIDETNWMKYYFFESE